MAHEEQSQERQYQINKFDHMDRKVWIYHMFTVSKDCMIQSLFIVTEREQYLRAHGRMFLSGPCNLILLHLSEVSSVCNSTGDVGCDDFLEVTESADCGGVV
jgi:hypothetical protein